MCQTVNVTLLPIPNSLMFHIIRDALYCDGGGPTLICCPNSRDGAVPGGR